MEWVSFVMGGVSDWSERKYWVESTEWMSFERGLNSETTVTSTTSPIINTWAISNQRRLASVKTVLKLEECRRIQSSKDHDVHCVGKCIGNVLVNKFGPADRQCWPSIQCPECRSWNHWMTHRLHTALLDSVYWSKRKRLRVDHSQSFT